MHTQVTSQIEMIISVRITNLPASATVTIYTTNGILVRRFTKSDPLQTFIEWDLRNANRIPIATGVYIIHVNCPGVGEKTLKMDGSNETC